MRLKHLLLSGLALAATPLARPAFAQLASAQPTTSDADALAGQMRVLAANPRDLTALIRAGELATRLGDMSGAGALFTRAEKIDPRNARIKAGEGRLLVASERPGDGLRHFAEAEALGLPADAFALDRGLAWDLLGQQDRAQRDYRLALHANPNDDEATRRYALSLGISGYRTQAMDVLDPLLRKNDRGAWRARAFVLAMDNDIPGAEHIADTMMPGGMGDELKPFFQQLPLLAPLDRAFAVHFGETKASSQRMADARLMPALTPLGPDPFAPVAVATVVAPPPLSAKEQRRQKRRGKQTVQVAAVTPGPAPLPAPPAYDAGMAMAATSEVVQPLPGVQMMPQQQPTATQAANAAAFRSSLAAASAPTPPSGIAAAAAGIAAPSSPSLTLASRPTTPVAAASTPAYAAAQPISRATAPAASPGVAATGPAVAATVPAATTPSPAAVLATAPATAAREPASGYVVAATTSPSGTTAATMEPATSAPTPPGAPLASTPAVTVSTPPAASSPSPAPTQMASASPPSPGFSAAVTGPAVGTGTAASPVLAAAMPEALPASVPTGTARNEDAVLASVIDGKSPTPAAAPVRQPEAQNGPVPSLATEPPSAAPVQVAEAVVPSRAAAAPSSAERPAAPLVRKAESTTKVAETKTAAADKTADTKPTATGRISGKTTEAAVASRGKAATGKALEAKTRADDEADAAAKPAVEGKPRGKSASARATGSEVTNRGKASDSKSADRGKPGDKGKTADAKAKPGDKTADPKGKTADAKGKPGDKGRPSDAKGKTAKADATSAKPATKAVASSGSYWVQVAGGAQEGDLHKAWSAVQAKSAALKGRQGFATPLRATNRVLTGPFKTQDEAQAFVNKLGKDGVSAFTFQSSKGQKIDKLAPKSSK